jgi:arginyl-tRNA synthetase
VLKDAEAVYGGEYIDELNVKYAAIGELQEVGEKAAADILENYIKKTTKEKMQISFDEWVSEKKLYEEKFVDRAIEILKAKNFTYESEGALWFKTTEFGDDKDRVLIKENGEKTYFASDCGYILNKIERGFDRIIEIWGADHHGYITRFAAAVKALGFSGDVRFLITQLVRLVKDGQEVKMSKRAGNVVCIDDLIEEVGTDVTRFFFLMYSPDTESVAVVQHER